MKVRVAFTLDIDDDAWQLAYGVDRTEVREDVNTYVRESVTVGLADMGLLKDRS